MAMVPFIDFHTHRPIWRSHVLQVVNLFPSDDAKPILGQVYSMGIHPWYVNESTVDLDIEVINNNLLNNSIQFVGECGLDQLRGADMLLQKAVFIRQIELAEKYHKPIVVHCVKAFNELLEIKKRIRTSVPWIIHGYTGSDKLAQQLIDCGFYLSLGVKKVIQSSSKDLLTKIPVDRIFLETDEADIDIEDSYAIFAQHRNLSVDELKIQINNNYKLIISELK